MSLNYVFPLDIIRLISKFYTDDEWIQCYDLRLKYKMYGFGYLLVEDYIITFGGFANTGSGGLSQQEIDDIFVLDLLNKDRGWIELNVKCPMKSVYKAILNKNNDVHLIGYYGHFSIPLQLLLLDLLDCSMEWIQGH